MATIIQTIAGLPLGEKIGAIIIILALVLVPFFRQQLLSFVTGIVNAIRGKTAEKQEVEKRQQPGRRATDKNRSITAFLDQYKENILKLASITNENKHINLLNAINNTILILKGSISTYENSIDREMINLYLVEYLFKEVKPKLSNDASLNANEEYMNNSINSLVKQCIDGVKEKIENSRIKNKESILKLIKNSDAQIEITKELTKMYQQFITLDSNQQETLKHYFNDTFENIKSLFEEE